MPLSCHLPCYSLTVQVRAKWPLRRKNVPWIAPRDVPAADGNRTRLPTLGRSYSTNELQPRVSTMPVYHFDPAKATTFISFTDVPWAADRRRPVSSIRQGGLGDSCSTAISSGDSAQQSRFVALIPGSTSEGNGQVFFADCRPLREVRGFHDSLIAKCNLKNVEFYRFPCQDLCDSHPCRGNPQSGNCRSANIKS